MYEGRTCLIIDDIVDTAGTLVKTAHALLDEGAVEVYACASHPVLSGPAVERIASSPLKELVVTNSIPLCEEAQSRGQDQGAVDCRPAWRGDREHSHGDERELAL